MSRSSVYQGQTLWCCTIELDRQEARALVDLLERTSRRIEMDDLDELTNQLLGLEI